MGGRQFEAATSEVLEGEVVEETPREGTLAWLQLQPQTEVEGLGMIPACHRLDLIDGSIYQGEPDKYCRFIRPDGRRCQAHRLKAFQICIVHAGGGGTDLTEMSRLGQQARARLSVSRKMLGIGPARNADPRSLLRLRAHERAEALVEAALSPLDDDDLGSLARQRSALAVLDAAFPQQTVQVTVEMPSDEAGVQALSWPEMQALAAQLLGDRGVTPELDPA